MNLLIVDDEEITREGIIQRVPWSQFGIDQINQADDGINALHIVKDFKPDIVLTDVRMPRMDGIQMSIRLKELYPDAAIIFMSGYSDKEYLKAAIQLKAVDYVDKPIIIGELTSAVQNAVAQSREKQMQEQVEQAVETYMKVSLPLLRNELAAYLLNRDMNIDFVAEKSRNACIDIPNDGLFITVIVKLFWDENIFSEHITTIKSTLISSVENAYSKYKIKILSTFRNEDNLVMHLFVNPSEKHIFTEERLQKFFEDAVFPLKNRCRFIVSVGKRVQGLANIQDSYRTALSNLGRFFFKGYNSILFYNSIPNGTHGLDTICFKSFIELADEEKLEESIFFIKSIVSKLSSQEDTEVSSVKNFFYSILLELNKLAQQRGFDLFECTTDTHLWEILLKLHTLYEFEDFLIEKLNTFFEISRKKSKNYNLIDKIYKYVHQHYFDADLSIDKISEYTHFAPTYVCSVFKERTTKTLNQYITEFRIEKSKEFLRDQNMKVSDIALKVGCRDSGYFTKLFRKTTGITPSEYRENISHDA